MKPEAWLALLSFVFLFLFVSCASYQLEKSLNPESREFLSKVRYIITSQERKIFLHLPPLERPKFIEEFWKKRDPDPDTEENKFKEEYFKRIEEANHLFVEGGTPGWLQDRGRIYILIGAPERRDVYPRGMSFYGRPTEIWWYGFFPIRFIDESEAGNYKLEPLSAYNIAEINKAQMETKPRVAPEKVVFDFHLDVKKIEEKEAVIEIEVPYKNIWFAENGNNLKTTLELSLEILDPSEKKVWEYQKNYPVVVKEEELEKITEKKYPIRIRVALEPGTYYLVLNLRNKTDNSKVSKKGKFVI